MTVDVAALRTRLADAVRSVVDSTVTVYPSAIDGIAGLPGVVLGMPSWKPGPTACFDQFEVPVAVIVARPGISDAATVDQLDALWPSVLAGLQSLEDQGLIQVTRAEFGAFSIQGQAYPAQLIFCTITE